MKVFLMSVVCRYFLDLKVVCYFCGIQCRLIKIDFEQVFMNSVMKNFLKF